MLTKAQAISCTITIRSEMVVLYAFSAREYKVKKVQIAMLYKLENLWYLGRYNLRNLKE